MSNSLNKNIYVRHWWLMPVILAIQEAEIRRVRFKASPGQIVHKNYFEINPSQNRASRVASCKCARLASVRP
jgi:hypothetical protein